jgi:hypothetical protein
MSKVRIQITGDNPKAVEFVRLLIVGCDDGKITSYGKTNVSRRDKYRGNGIAYIDIEIDDALLKAANITLD